MYSKQKVKENRLEELSTKAKLEVATASLHDDIYNVKNQGEANQVKNILKDIEMRKARGVAIRSRVKWKKVGNKCSAEFF